MQTSYNGWSNYETWLASLWLNENDQAQRFLHSVKDVDTDVSKQAAWLHDQMSLQLEDEIGVPCLWHDLLHAAFAQINWTEVVESI